MDDKHKDYELRGIDYDLEACLDYNQQTFTVGDIERVLAVWEGQNDGDDWRWVLALKNGKFAFLQGGCDYTGWDCQSWAASTIDDTPEQAAEHAQAADFPGSPENAGLGHLLAIFSGTYGDNFSTVRDSLMQQIATKKKTTWRDEVKPDMPDVPMI